MEGFYIILLIIGVTALFGGIFSSAFKEHPYLSQPLTAFLIGVVIGPSAFALLDPPSWSIDKNTVLLEAARLTLVVMDMGVALRLPRGYMLRRWRSMAVVLGLLMPLMWLASGLTVWLLLGLPFWVAMLVGAVVASTDPIAASSIVTGGVANRNIPARVRHLISGESGSNDGLAYPIVLLPVLILTYPTGEAMSRWSIEVLLGDIGGAVLFGAFAGTLAAWLLNFTASSKVIPNGTFLAYTFALSLLVIGASKLISVDAVLAVFVAGSAYRMARLQGDQSQDEKVQQTMSTFFTLPFFVLFGVMAPWGEWAELGWKGIAVALVVLLVRRLPWVWLIRSIVPGLKATKDVWFVGWFGPVGVSTVFYAILALQKSGHSEGWVLGSLVVFMSLVAHGMSATPLTRLYGRMR